jgi:hypothetical protein
MSDLAHPPRHALPQWPSNPDAIDPEAATHLVIAIGSAPETSEVAGAWVRAAEAVAATTMLVLDNIDDPADRAGYDEVLASARTGVRILIVGGQYDVLRALAIARDAGAIPAELSAYVVDTSELPLYCAHCRDTHRVGGAPGDFVTCPGCARLLEIHPHLAAASGSFLASEAA